MRDYQAEVIDLEREITELKTAQTKPGNSAFFQKTATLPAGSWNGSHTWTIQYEDVGNTDAPITYTNTLSNITLEPYDSDTNTQTLEFYLIGTATYASDQTIPVMSSRPIASITFNG